MPRLFLFDFLLDLCNMRDKKSLYKHEYKHEYKQNDDRNRNQDDRRHDNHKNDDYGDFTTGKIDLICVIATYTRQQKKCPVI